MTSQTLEYFLSSAGVGYDKQKWTDSQAWVSCPLAPWTHSKGTDHNPSCGINFEKTPAFYNCFTCHASGSLKDMFWRLYEYTKNSRFVKVALDCQKGDQLPFSEKLRTVRIPGVVRTEAEDDDKMDTTTSGVLENFKPAFADPQCWDYVVRQRNIIPEVAKKAQLLYDSDKRMVIYPGYSRDYTAVEAVVGRSVKAKEHYNYFGLPTANHLGGSQFIDDEVKTVVLAEGLFDLLRGLCISTARPDIGVVSCWTSKASERHMRLLQEFARPVVCLFDNNDAGNAGYQKLKERLNGLVPLRRRFLSQSSEVDLGHPNLDLNQVIQIIDS